VNWAIAPGWANGKGLPKAEVARNEQRNQQKQISGSSHQQPALTLEHNWQLALHFFPTPFNCSCSVGCGYHPTHIHSYSHKNAPNFNAVQLELGTGNK
jgi:hypothetical protein